MRPKDGAARPDGQIISRLNGTRRRGSCPDAAQYFGKLVNGVDRMLLIGAYRFPDNKPIIELEEAAKASASSSNTFATDAILFGEWRD